MNATNLQISCGGAVKRPSRDLHVPPKLCGFPTHWCIFRPPTTTRVAQLDSPPLDPSEPSLQALFTPMHVA